MAMRHFGDGAQRSHGEKEPGQKGLQGAQQTISMTARARSSAGEHYGDIVGVVGSNPTAPTIPIISFILVGISNVGGWSCFQQMISVSPNRFRMVAGSMHKAYFRHSGPDWIATS